MARGRKPTPTHLRIIAGNPGKRPINGAEPKPKRARPEAPSYMDAESKKIWDAVVKELDDISILTSIDVFAVETLCAAIADHRSSVRQIEANAKHHREQKKTEPKEEPIFSSDGRYYRTVSGTGSAMWRAHPAIAVRSDADRRIRGWCAEFGLTPAARTRLVVGTGGGTVDPAEDDEFGLGA